ARVVRPGAVKAAAVARACTTLVAEPHALRAGGTSIVLAKARNRFGRPLRGLSVRAVGVGIDHRARTDRRGGARLSLTPAPNGLVSPLHGKRLPPRVRARGGTPPAVPRPAVARPATPRGTPGGA